MVKIRLKNICVRWLKLRIKMAANFLLGRHFSLISKLGRLVSKLPFVVNNLIVLFQFSPF